MRRMSLSTVFRQFQLFGNFASHDQDDQSKYLNKNIAESLLKFYDEALKIYRRWLQDKKSVSGE